MPEQRKPPANGRRPNGPNHAATFWKVTLVVGGDLELLVEDVEGSSDIGISVCSKCAGLIPGSDTSKQLHKNWHEAINGLEDRTTR